MEVLKISIFAKRLKQVMDSKNITGKELARRSGVSASSISDYLNDKYEAKQDNIFLISKALNISPSWLMGLIDDEEIKKIDVELIEIPILGSIPAGTPVEAVENIQGSQLIPQDALRYPEKEYFCLKISGSSMYPTYIDGDIVLFHSQFEANSGQDVCVYVNGYDATFKRLMMHEDGLELIAINPEYENRFYTIEECQEIPVRVIGVAVKLIRNLE